MPRRPHTRDHQLYRKREADPQLGAKRYVDVFSPGLREFYYRVEDALAEALGNTAGKAARLYDDLDPESPTRPAVKIFERRLVTDFSRRQRIGWTMNDVGRTKTTILNEVAKIEEPSGLSSDGSLVVTFDGVVRIGSGDTKGKRKFALIADQATDGAGYLVEEHIAVFDGLKENLKGKSSTTKELTFPYGDYVPQLPLGIFEGGMPNKVKNDAIAAIQEVLDDEPLVCTLEPLLLYSNQEISLGPQDNFEI